MKMNKKGFTLIELLAVIVILAVIALIAVPQILNILNKARSSAAADSAYGILKAAETSYTQYLLDNHGDSMGAQDFVCTTSGCTATFTAADGSSKSETLEFKGTKPTYGTIHVDNEGKATITETTDSDGDGKKKGLVINGFSCTNNKNKPDVIDCTDQY